MHSKKQPVPMRETATFRCSVITRFEFVVHVIKVEKSSQRSKH